MKLGPQLLLFALSVLHAHAEEYLNFFGEAEPVSTGMLIVAPPELSNPGQILTFAGDEALYWDENTGELLQAEEADTQIQTITEPLLIDSVSADLLAYLDPDDQLVLIRRSTGDLIGIHNFDTEYNEREIIKLELLPHERLLSVYTEPEQPPCNTPFCAQSFSSHYYLIDTQTGDIARTFTPGGHTIYNYLSPPGSDFVLIVNSGDPFQDYVPIPGQQFLPNSSIASEIQFIDPSTGNEILPPLGSEEARHFSGSFTFDESGEHLYAILDTGHLTKIHLASLSVSEVEIPNHTGASQMRIVGDTLFALLLKPESFSPQFRLASWNTETLQANPSIESVNANASGIYNYIPSPTAEQAILSDRDGTIEMWDISQGSFLRTIKTLSIEQTFLQWNLSPDGQKLFAHIREQTYPDPATHAYYVWNTSNGSRLLKSVHQPEQIAPPIAQFTSDSGKILLYTPTSEIEAIDLSTGETAFTLEHSKAIATGYYASGDKRLIVHANGLTKQLSEDGTVTPFQLPESDITPYHIEASSGRFLYGFQNALRTYTPDTNETKTIWSNPQSDLPDRAFLTTDSTRLHLFWQVYDNTDVQTPSRSLVIDLENNTELADIKTAAVSALAYSPDGQQFAYSPNNQFLLKIHSLDTGETLNSIDWPEKVDSITFAPDNQTLYLLSGSKLRHFDIASQATLAAVPLASASSANAIDRYRSQISADGRLLTLAGFSGNLELFSLPSLQPITTPTPGLAHSLYNHEFSISLAPDASEFLSIDFLGTVRQWDLIAGRPSAASFLRSTSGNFTLTLATKPSHRYKILRSEDLQNWTEGPPVAQVESVSTIYISTQNESQFYKVIEFPLENN